VSIVYQYAKECLDFNQSSTTLYRIINSIGYSYKKVYKWKIVIERQQIVNWRIRFCHKYLQLLKEPDVKFVFLDETWVYQNRSQVRQWVLENNSKGIPSSYKGEGKRYTIVNAGCDQGFLPDCDLILDSKINDRNYHKTMNGKLFYFILCQISILYVISLIRENGKNGRTPVKCCYWKHKSNNRNIVFYSRSPLG
jgi:hypothetical protein